MGYLIIWAHLSTSLGTQMGCGQFDGSTGKTTVGYPFSLVRSLLRYVDVNLNDGSEQTKTIKTITVNYTVRVKILQKHAFKKLTFAF